MGSKDKSVFAVWYKVTNTLYPQPDKAAAEEHFARLVGVNPDSTVDDFALVELKEL